MPTMPSCFRCRTPITDAGGCACKDGIALVHGDCTSILPLFAPRTFDLLCTDPPYGIGEADGKNKSRGCLATSRDYGKDSWDNSPPDAATLSLAIAVADKAILWGGNYFGLPASPCWLVWDKENGATDFADCELAWTNFDKAVRKFTWKWQGMLQEWGGARKEARLHPTQKPLALMKWCIAFAGTPSTILDCYAGSGTTLLAAKLLGCRCLGIEREEKYVKVAAERLRQNVLPLTD